MKRFTVMKLMSEKTFKNHLIYTENYFYFHLIEPSEVSVVTEKQRNRSLKLNHALSFDSKYLLKVNFNIRHPHDVQVGKMNV